MKRLLIIIAAVGCLSLGDWIHPGQVGFNGGMSQGQSSFLLYGRDDPFINELKSAQLWSYSSTSSPYHPAPDELDANGYPLYGANAFNHGGVFTVYFGPSQAERPGNQVRYWNGTGTVGATEVAGGGTVVTAAHGCQYSSNGGAFVDGTYVGSPIFTCSNLACTGTCIGRWEFSVTGETVTTGFVEWNISIKATGNGNPITNLAAFHANDASCADETLYLAGEKFGCFFKARLKAGGFGVWRYLDWSQATQTACLSWAMRKPVTYFMYHSPEFRLSWFAGTSASLSPAYNAGTNTYTATLPGTYSWPGFTPGGAPVDKQVILVFWGNTSQFTAATSVSNSTGIIQATNSFSAGQIVAFGGGTLPAAYVAGTPYYVLAANLSGSQFEVSATNGGSVIIPATTAMTSGVAAQVFLDIGSGPLPLTNPQGGAEYTNATNTSGYIPTVGYWASLVWDAALGSWLHLGGLDFANAAAPSCGVPPEVEVQLAAEVGMHPWFDEYYLAAEPLSDYFPSLATYIKNNAPAWMVPRFIAMNEPWNYDTFAGFGDARALAYWGITGGHLNWDCMAASLLGQAIYNVYGDRSRYEVLVEPQTDFGGASSIYPMITCPQFVANGPARAGYAQDPAYKWLTSIGINNYWTPTENPGSVATAITLGLISDGWCYVNQGTGCAASATILTNFVATALNAGGFGITQYNTWFIGWATWLKGNANQCGGNAVNCNILNMFGYEGGYNNNFLGADANSNVSSATNANPAVLTTSAINGCYPGMTVALTSVTGGTWAASYSGLTVDATSGSGTTTCKVNIDSTLLGTLTGATLTYTGSETYVNTMLTASYSSAEVGTLTTTNYNNFVAAGGRFPSMFAFTGQTPPLTQWTVLFPSIYGATDSASDPGTPQWQAIETFNAH